MSGYHRPLKAYLSLPFGAESEDIYNRCLKNIGSFVPDLDLRTFRIDPQAYQRPNIWSRIRNEIDSSNIIIADISVHHDSLPDIHVIYEVGYASGKSIPSILIGESGKDKNMPLNHNDNSGIIEYRGGIDEDFDNLSLSLSEAIKKIVESDIRGEISGDFQIEGFVNRESINLPERIKNAKRNVSILTTSLEYINTYLLESLKQALEANRDNDAFDIVMLTMHTESDIVNGRAEQLGISPRRFRDDLRKSLQEVVNAFRAHRKVEILTYTTLPTQITYIIDDTVVTAVASLGQKSRHGINFVIHEISPIVDEFRGHFRMLKSISKRVEGQEL